MSIQENEDSTGRTRSRRDVLKLLGGGVGAGLTAATIGLGNDEAKGSSKPVVLLTPRGRAANLAHDSKSSEVSAAQVTAFDNTEVIIRSDGNVSQAEAQSFADGISLGKSRYAKIYGATQFPADIYMRSLPQDPHLAGTFKSVISVNVANPGWKSATPLEREKIGAHELFHALQDNLSGGRPFAEWGPYYVTEGSGEFNGWESMVDGGFLTHEDFIKRELTSLKNVKVPSLASINDKSGGLSYPVSALAANLLTERSGTAAFGNYYSGLRNNAPWETAFANAFGEPHAEFEGRFDSWIKSNL